MNESVCPYLGRADDRETAFAFASPGHRCYRLDQSSPITLAHQSTYCLGQNFQQCPVFQLAAVLEPSARDTARESLQDQEIGQPVRGDSLPPIPGPALRARQWMESISRRLRSWLLKAFRIDAGENPVMPFIFITALAILLVALLFFTIVSFSSLTSPQTDTAPEVRLTGLASQPQPEIVLVTLTPTMRSAFVQKLGIAGVSRGTLLVPLAEPQLEPSPITIVVTPTDQPTEVPRYYACGAPSDWVLYIVQPGDSLTGLSVEYDVPLFELSSNNCLGVTDNLYFGQQLYVPGN